MAWQHTVLVYPTLLATATSLAVGAYTARSIRRRGPSPTLVTFLAVTVALVLWTGLSAIKLLHTDPATKLLAYRLLYVGNAPLGPLVLLFALAYTDRERWLRRSVVVLLLVPSAIYVVLVFTNPYDLAIEAVRVFETGGLVVLRVDTGPAHLLLIFCYNATLAVLAAGTVVYEATRLGPAYVPQAVLLGVSPLLPILFSVGSSLGFPLFEPKSVNVVPISGAFVSVLFGTAVFRYRMLDLPPLAYTTAVRESPDAVFVLDRDERVVHTNDAGERLLDRQSATVADPVDAVLPGFDPESGAAEPIETRSGDGSVLFLDVRTQALDRYGTPVGWVVVLNDVTERRLQRQRIEAQNEQLEQFASIVSHDLRNPLSVASGYLSLLGQDYDDDRIDEIADALERMDDIVDDTLTLAREGQPVTELDWIDLGAVARESWGYVETESATLDVVDDSRVRCDPGRLRHLFENLFRNSVEHGSTSPDSHTRQDAVEHGSTTPRSRGREDALEQTGPVVTVRVGRLDDRGFYVEDDGPGIASEDRERVFDPGHTSAADGTGFGLAIVERVAEAHGWSVTVTTGERGGARFEVHGVDLAADDVDG